MTFLYAVLGLAVLFIAFLLGVGIYELIVETRQDSISYTKSNQYLHLKHLEHINSGK